MLDIQLGRRNLSPIQRIAVAEKYRPIYEKQAKGNQGTRNDLKPNFTVNLPQSSNKQERNPTTDKKLSDIAGVSEKTYRMGAKVLNSDNEDVKQRVLSGEPSISAGYKELIWSIIWVSKFVESYMQMEHNLCDIILLKTYIISFLDI